MTENRDGLFLIAGCCIEESPEDGTPCHSAWSLQIPETEEAIRLVSALCNSVSEHSGAKCTRLTDNSKKMQFSEYLQFAGKIVFSSAPIKFLTYQWCSWNVTSFLSIPLFLTRDHPRYGAFPQPWQHRDIIVTSLCQLLPNIILTAWETRGTESRGTNIQFTDKC